jgi:hypothetical protein
MERLAAMAKARKYFALGDVTAHRMVERGPGFLSCRRAARSPKNIDRTGVAELIILAAW